MKVMKLFDFAAETYAKHRYRLRDSQAKMRNVMLETGCNIFSLKPTCRPLN